MHPGRDGQREIDASGINIKRTLLQNTSELLYSSTPSTRCHPGLLRHIGPSILAALSPEEIMDICCPKSNRFATIGNGFVCFRRRVFFNVIPFPHCGHSHELGKRGCRVVGSSLRATEDNPCKGTVRSKLNLSKLGTYFGLGC
ncbi:hypothetical protein TNCV_201991 [Trichonephila clavipes]|nr:hypothetical protein TNCV_201991 [Trichonephila clavipes]